MKFENKVIVITGGSSGLGFGLAEVFCQQGAKLVLIARNMEKLKAAEFALKNLNKNANIQLLSVDIADENKAEEAVAAIIKHYGRIDMLINSAGILAEGYFEKTSLDSFKAIMDTNFIALVNMTRLSLPYLKESKGRIINIASMASYFGTFGYTAYCASKFAVLGFSEALRYELKPQGIRVQIVCPPEFAGPMVDGISANRTSENKKLVQTAGTLSVEQVVKETISGIESRRFSILIGSMSRILAVVNRYFPGLVRKYLDITIKKIYIGPAQKRAE